MKLVIAEKPSVAQSLAKVIGANQKKDGYLEGNGYIVSWCVGHLIELANPEHYDEKYKKWRKEELPIFPAPFSYQVTASTKKQYQVLKDLMKRSDVDSLVEATDAGREGELIFRFVYKLAGCKKPFERLWISSMEDKAIKEGFENLSPSAEYDDLYEAALCRERADWLVGINATRFFSTVYGQTLNVGRVMTPTLAMIVEREAEIKGFKPENFYTVQMLVSGVAVTSKRFKTKQEAEGLAQKVNAADKAKISKMETTTKSEKPPLLYDLTSLQRDANKYYGFTAQQTLDYTQSLYEKKLVTYPRTDSRYLTDDMDDSTARLCCLMKDKYRYTKMVPISTKQVLNSSKVSDHHAIIPTENVSDADYSEIPSGEQKILGLVTARLLSSVGDSAEITEYALEVECAGEVFKAKSKCITSPGWHLLEDWILGKKQDDGEDDSGKKDDGGSHGILEILEADASLLSEGRELPARDPKVKEGKTTPKKRFTEDSLFSAMESAGAKDMPDEVERKGLGTPATRAGVIEKLVRIGFVERQGSKKTKYLVPTEKGTSLITVMPEQIQSASMTTEWEQKLLEVEKRDIASEDFMAEIKDMIVDLIETYEPVKGADKLFPPRQYKQHKKYPKKGASRWQR
ncbi:MAG: DNA topoisomerase III [Lachnospiraceae bacterium]|nr:MAG: DNA topoisomerase III [Lachnospiraceae bacterium]